MKNKKKLIVFALVMVMVLSVCITALVGCKDKDVPNGYHKLKDDQKPSFESILGSAVANTVENNGLDNLKFGTELAVNTNYGGSEQKFLITMDANLAFNIKDNNTNHFAFQIKDAAANTNVLAINYMEGTTLAEETENVGDPASIGNGKVYVAIGDGANAKYFTVNALSIKSVLRTQWIPGEVDASGNVNYVHPSIDAAGAADLGDAITTGLSDSVYGIIDIVAGLCTIFESNNNDGYIIRLDVAKLLNEEGLKTLLAEASGEFNKYAEDLGLKVQFEALSELLPKLVLDINVDFAGVEKGADDPYANSEIAGFGVSLSVKKKDFSIKKLDNSDFIRINIAKDFKADFKFKFKFGNDVTVPNPVGGASKYTTTINAINFKAAGELKLNEGIEATINLGGENKTIIIPKGNYKINIEADIDPTQLIGMEFNSNSTGETVQLVIDVLKKVVKTLKLEIVDQTDTNKKLLVVLQNTDEGLFFNLDTSLIQGTLLGKDETDSLGSLINLLTNDGEGTIIDDNFLDTLMIIVNKFLADSETTTGAFNLSALKAVIDNLSIVADAGKLTVDLKNLTVNENVGELGNTTVDANLELDKTGLKVVATLKNLIAHGEKADITATITANKDGLKLVAKSTAPIKVTEDGSIKIPVDLELSLTSFEFGACGK